MIFPRFRSNGADDSRFGHGSVRSVSALCMGKKPNSQLSNKCRKYAVYNLDKLSCRPVGYTGILMYSQIGCTAHSFRIIIVTYFLLVKKWLLYALPPNPTSPSNRQTQKFSPAMPGQRRSTSTHLINIYWRRLWPSVNVWDSAGAFVMSEFQTRHSKDIQVSGWLCR